MNKRNTGQREQDVLTFIRTFRLEHGYPPTIREIGAGIGLKSVGSIHHMVKALHARGAIIWHQNRKRSIELIPASPVLSVELPPHLYAQVQDIARKAKVTPEAVVIEAVRDGFAAFRSASVPRIDNHETPDPCQATRGTVGLLNAERTTKAIEQPTTRAVERAA